MAVMAEKCCARIFDVIRREVAEFIAHIPPLLVGGYKSKREEERHFQRCCLNQLGYHLCSYFEKIKCQARAVHA